VAILGIDVGGTFTDAVLLEDGRLRTAKVPTARNQEDSVLEAAAAVGARELERFTHGTTIATNALLERRGATTALVATEGFEHVLHLRRQDRAHLYRLCAAHTEPLVPLERSFGVRGRIGPDGELASLDLSTLPDLGEVEAIAVCLLFSFRDPSHEQAVAAELRRRHPRAHVVASHESAPEFREYERASTTAADAYLGPLLGRYLHALAARCADAGLPVPLVMRSSGGVAPLEEAAAHAARALLSGPAAGVVGAGRVAQLAGIENALAFDMGGTSTDVCAIVGGEATRSSKRLVGGLPIRLPTLDVHTVGAGGGSIVWRDAGGALRVGPASAGAEPGPACYGRGGALPTVTDANLLLGRLPQRLAGGLELDIAAAERALARVGAVPEDVIDVVDAEMLAALRVVSVERGLDPRDFALVAFGGAGALHACALADELGIETVLVPEAAGVLSALGLALGDERRDHVRSLVVPLAGAHLPADGEADVRYAGQSFAGGDARMNVQLQVIGFALRAIADEMGAALIRSAFSANIKERRDCSTAIFDDAGRMVAQAEHIPVHLGAMPASVASVLACDPGPDDVFILNDPYAGGTHLPDITLVSRTELGFAATRAHHADVGGSVPGSMPADSRTLAEEGVVIPPTRLDDVTLDDLSRRYGTARSAAATCAPSSRRSGWARREWRSCARGGAGTRSLPRWTSSAHTRSGTSGPGSPRCPTAATRRGSCSRRRTTSSSSVWPSQSGATSSSSASRARRPSTTGISTAHSP
jgi:N-methylhydantoinase A